MRIFVTGATGFIGSALVKELLANGHTVIGLARSDASAKALETAGAEVHRGALDDLASLRAGAAACDGVAHLAYIHALGHATLGARVRVFLGGSPTGIIPRFMAMTGETDRAAIEAMGAALVGTGKPLVITAGLFALKIGALATEDSPLDPDSKFRQRVASEVAVEKLATQGVRAAVVRLPPTVHGDNDHGFVPMIVKVAQKKGFSAYAGDGSNVWSRSTYVTPRACFASSSNAARRGAKYHGVAEEGIPTKAIAESIGRHLNVPVRSVSRAEVLKLFSFVGEFFAASVPASGALTQQRLDWHPEERGLLEDLERSNYFESAAVPAYPR